MAEVSRKTLESFHKALIASRQEAMEYLGKGNCKTVEMMHNYVGQIKTLTSVIETFEEALLYEE